MSLRVSSNEYGAKLGYDKIDFSDVDFLSPLDPPLPYKTTSQGLILRYHVSEPKGPWARWPVDVSAILNFIFIQLMLYSDGSLMPVCRQMSSVLLRKSNLILTL